MNKWQNVLKAVIRIHVRSGVEQDFVFFREKASDNQYYVMIATLVVFSKMYRLVSRIHTDHFQPVIFVSIIFLSEICICNTP